MTALMKAIYQALSAASAPVYDHVPQGAAYPYIVLESVTAFDADYLVERKEQVTVYISVWSNYRGQKQTLDLLAEISSILHGKKLPMESGRMASTMSVNTQTNREPDAVTFMGQARVSVLIEH